MDLFHYKKTNIKKDNPSKDLSLKDFIATLKPDDIAKAIEISKVTDVAPEKWQQFLQYENQEALRDKLKAQATLELGLEQKFRLQMNLERLKASLGMLKQKLLILRSRFEQLKHRITAL